MRAVPKDCERRVMDCAAADGACGLILFVGLHHFGPHHDRAYVEGGGIIVIIKTAACRILFECIWRVGRVGVAGGGTTVVFIHDDHREFCGQCAAPSARTAL